MLYSCQLHLSDGRCGSADHRPVSQRTSKTGVAEMIQRREWVIGCFTSPWAPVEYGFVRGR